MHFRVSGPWFGVVSYSLGLFRGNFWGCFQVFQGCVLGKHFRVFREVLGSFGGVQGITAGFGVFLGGLGVISLGDVPGPYFGVFQGSFGGFQGCLKVTIWGISGQHFGVFQHVPGQHLGEF